MSFMPSCRDITEHTSDYLDHTLPFWKRVGFRLHLFVCLNCRRYLEQMRLTIATLGRLKDEDQGPAVEQATVDDIVQHLKQEAPQPPRDR
jgi:hypothetical protein